MESSRTKETRDGSQKEEKEHDLLVPWQLTDSDIVFKQMGDVVSENVDAEGEYGEEQKANEMSPDVPGLCVQTKHTHEAPSH